MITKEQKILLDKYSAYVEVIAKLLNGKIAEVSDEHIQKFTTILYKNLSTSPRIGKHYTAEIYFDDHKRVQFEFGIGSVNDKGIVQPYARAFIPNYGNFDISMNPIEDAKLIVDLYKETLNESNTNMNIDETDAFNKGEKIVELIDNTDINGLQKIVEVFFGVPISIEEMKQQEEHYIGEMYEIIDNCQPKQLLEYYNKLVEAKLIFEVQTFDADKISLLMEQAIDTQVKDNVVGNLMVPISFSIKISSHDKGIKKFEIQYDNLEELEKRLKNNIVKIAAKNGVELPNIFQVTTPINLPKSVFIR